MNLGPPSGSRISVATEGAHPLIVVPHGSSSLVRYFLGLCFLALLGVWVVEFGRGVSEMSWRSIPLEGPSFIIFLLIMAARFLCAVALANLAYRSFRPSPESLRLMPNGVTYDSGIPPPTLQGYWDLLWGLSSPKAIWKFVFPKRTRVELDLGKLQSLQLRGTISEGNRLTVATDAERLDIAQSATEIDREWLYQLLANRYSLSLMPGR